MRDKSRRRAGTGDRIISDDTPDRALFVVVDADQAGAGRLHYLKPLASVSRAVPVMILDASADTEVNKHVWSTDLRALRDKSSRRAGTGHGIFSDDTRP